ncbi:MAG TPA: SCP2 sterol-binding domain-containing protein [Gammaproteobacteria bacterium]|nr:SCP2 sterol-binding domain-containing protein [Gammaproteobacteria bacterium]
MTRSGPVVPAPLARQLDRVASRVLGTLVNHLMAGQDSAERLREIEGKSLALQVDDLGARLVWRIAAGRLVSAAGAPAPDITIRGTWRDFARLALRSEDPDTLFFQRSLCLEGETETGLFVKNLLDAMEFDGELYLEGHFRPAAAERLRCMAREAHLPRRLERLRDAVRARL